MATMILKNNWFNTNDMGNDIVDFVRNHEDLTSMGRLHKCVSSADLVTKFRERAKNLGLVITKETAGLEKRGKKFMYLAEVEDEKKDKDYALTLGFRNFSDKTLSYSSIAGSNVFVCCNGVCNSICKDGKMRHTIGNVDRNLIDSKIDIAFDQFINDKDRIHEQIATMRGTTLTDDLVGKFVRRMTKSNYVGAANLVRMLEELENPTLNSHNDNSVMRLMNACSYITEHKITNPNQKAMASRECNNIIMNIIKPDFIPLGDVIDVEVEG